MTQHFHCRADANYRGLHRLYERYKAYGLQVIAFPCNQVRWACCAVRTLQLVLRPARFQHASPLAHVCMHQAHA